MSKILIVVTSHSRIDDEHLTGLWLEEFATPYNEFRANGHEIVVASPQGGAAPIDPRSVATLEQASDWAEASARLQNTLPLNAVSSQDFAAIFLPGGHGTMFDLPENPELAQLLSEFAEQGKIIAAVCHGPAGLVNAKLADGTPLVAGKTITAFTNEEERAAQMDALMPFLLEDRLRELGGQFVVTPNWSDHVEQAGQLITGQNPQSSQSVARAIHNALLQTTSR